MQAAQAGLDHGCLDVASVQLPLGEDSREEANQLPRLNERVVRLGVARRNRVRERCARRRQDADRTAARRLRPEGDRAAATVSSRRDHGSAPPHARLCVPLVHALAGLSSDEPLVRSRMSDSAARRTCALRWAALRLAISHDPRVCPDRGPYWHSF